MTFAESIRSVYWTNYANFRGRASRSEYWWITLFNYGSSDISRDVAVV